MVMTSEELVDESNATEPWELNAIIPNPELYALGNLSRNNIEFKFGNKYKDPMFYL